MTDAPEDWFAKYMAAQAELSKARGALAFIFGALNLCQQYGHQITPAIHQAMLVAAQKVLQYDENGEPKK